MNSSKVEKTEKHPKTEMIRSGEWNRVHQYTTGRRARIWHITFYCPICFGRKFPLRNTSRGKKYYCVGRMEIERWYDPQTGGSITFKEYLEKEKK